MGFMLCLPAALEGYRYAKPAGKGAALDELPFQAAAGARGISP